MTVTVEVDLDRKCLECHKGGATQSGVCLTCIAKAMGDAPLNSSAAKAMRARFLGMARTARKTRPRG